MSLLKVISYLLIVPQNFHTPSFPAYPFTRELPQMLFGKYKLSEFKFLIFPLQDLST